MERKIVIRKSRHIFDTIKQYTKPLGLAALILSIPLTVFVLNQVQDIRQRAAGELIPITSNFPQTGCRVDFNDLPASSTKSYKVPVFCLNQTYCVTQGFDKTSGDTLGLPFPSFGGDITTSRKFAVAFIAHYHTKVLKDWTPQPFTGTVFSDVPLGTDLGQEIETAAHYKLISGQVAANGQKPAFSPEDPWLFGFHGVYRKGSFDDKNPTPHPAEECWQGACYNFSAAGASMTRGAFLEQLYKYGIDPTHQDLSLCMAAPAVAATSTPTPPTVAACNSACTNTTQCALATDGCTTCKPSSSPAPELDFTKLTGSSCKRNFASLLSNGTPREPTYANAAYRLAAECLNKAYCVVQGYSEATCPAGSSCAGMDLSKTPPDGYLGGEFPTTRKFAVAFIARYHVDAIAASDSRHWTWSTPTGGIFKDVPLGDLTKEIETAYNKGFISGAPCNSIYQPGDPYYSADATVKCFDPEGNWVYGFKGIEKTDYFTGSTPINPWGTTIKRGDFLQQLYTFGTSPAHPDLAKCMTAPGTAGTCQNPAPACNASCSNNADCAGGQNGCTVCTAGKCKAGPACNATCSNNADCTGGQNGCTVCNSAGKCSPAPACDAACSNNADCAGGQNGCTTCTAGKCQVAPSCNSTCSNNADCAGGQSGCTVCNSAGKCSPPPACGTSCSTTGDCATAPGGCNTCNSTTGKCSVAACGVSCSRDSDCAGAATKDGCVSCLGGKCQLPFNAGACKCDGITASAIGTGQKVTFTAYSKVEGADVLSAIVKGVNIRVFRGGAEIQDEIAKSGFISPSVIESTTTKIRYQTTWDYTVPANANNGDLFRVVADMDCQPKILAIVPAKSNTGLFAKIINKITEPIRTILGESIAPAPIPTPTPAKSLQINSYYPGEITQRASCYLQFVIKR